MSPSRKVHAISPLVVRRRRAFGLDHARRPDPARVEAEVLAWLAEAAPDVVTLRMGGASPLAKTPMLLLLLPDARLAVLRIDPRPSHADRAARILEAGCARARIPLAVLTRAEDTRAALRRFGIEPEIRPEEA